MKDIPEHLDASSGGKPNRLIDEISPYLLQHAYNPVDWYAWGDEALNRARAQDKPIFLSIGYSACHWCHVMAHESFEDEPIAAFLNEHFISIKVDREERPDLDDLYMTAVQLLTGGGGWPMTVFLTPDLKPFFGGTYFAPDERFGRISFPALLERIHQVWTERRQEVLKSAGEITGALIGHAAGSFSAGGTLRHALLDEAARQLAQTWDPRHGGFGKAPKFPPTAALGLLMRQYARTGDAQVLEMVESTLGQMARGGICDQLGGGFHRYSVDEKWLVPHFEKMLYDQGLIVPVLLDAFQLTGNRLYERTARETLDYLLREMQDPCGGFHSSQDADSEGEEGAFYVWSHDQVRTLLGAEGEWFCAYYGITPDGCFEGKNILHVPVGVEAFAEARQWPVDHLLERLARARSRLFEARQQRVRPHQDDKVIAAWNGMAIWALAGGGSVLKDARYVQAAVRAAAFIRRRMICDGDLYRVFRNGKAAQPGYLDDYALLIHGLGELYEATFEPEWLALAQSLTERMIALFWDPQAGNFYYTSDQHRQLLTRLKPSLDGVEPSGNSVAVWCLQRLGVLLDCRDYREKAESILRACRSLMQQQPQGMANMLWGLDFHLGPRVEIALLGDPEEAGMRELLEVIYQRYLPNKVMALSDGGGRVPGPIPLLAGKQRISGQATAYVCADFTCRTPATSPALLQDHLAAVGN